MRDADETVAENTEAAVDAEVVEEEEEGESLTSTRSRNRKAKITIPKGNWQDIEDKIALAVSLPVANFTRATAVQGCVSSGSLVLDIMMGGGPPPGRWTMFSGPEQSGKTTILQQTVRNALRKEIPCRFLDHEQSLDAMYMQSLGIPLYDSLKSGLLKIFWPSSGESSYNYIVRLLRAMPDVENPYDVKIIFFIDSIYSMIPETMIEDESMQNAQKAALQSRFMPMVRGLLARKGAMVVSTNQLRTNPRQMFGNPIYETCGDAPKYLPDVRVSIKRAMSANKHWEERGMQLSEVYFTTLKNRVFPPMLTGTTALAYGVGIEPMWDIYNALLMTGQIAESGKGYYGFQSNNPKLDSLDAMDWDSLVDLFSVKKPKTIKKHFEAIFQSGQVFQWLMETLGRLPPPALVVSASVVPRPPSAEPVMETADHIEGNLPKADMPEMVIGLGDSVEEA